MPAMENAHALLIGIANYQHVRKLPSAVKKDVEDIYNLLVDPQHCGYPPDNVDLLRDEEASEAAMRQALADLAARSDEDSTVFFYISSHGGQIESGPDAGEYLLPVGAKLDTAAAPDAGHTVVVFIHVIFQLVHEPLPYPLNLFVSGIMS